MNTADTTSSKEPIRLFQSDILEFFTHIHPAAVAAVYLPLILFLLMFGTLQGAPGGAWVVPLLWAVGLLMWTPSEYLLHRFLFHFTPRTPRQERVSFLFHGVHHAQPMVKTRLVMPPALSLPLAGLFFLFFRLVFLAMPGGLAATLIVSSGFLSGYLLYDMLHYAMHHFNIKSGYVQKVRRNHMRHHALTPNKRFGVTTLFWDRIFRTYVED
ncbi:MAG: sterol desaturase family protein [Spirochaetia bacterium]|nr:sterol desaturase family protein [Spirochaetia bacterium]